MKLISTILLLMVLFSVGQSYAQVEDFNFSDYKLPELKRKTLETNFNLSGHNNYSVFRNFAQLGFNEYNYNRYDGDISITYTSYVNNAAQQKWSQGSLSFSSYFYNRKEDKQLSYKNWSLTPSIYYNTINRRYYSSNNFHETNINISYSHMSYLQTYFSANGDENKNDNMTNKFTIVFPLKIGNGRIEQVQDARHAIYLFDELIKQKRITSEKNQEEVIALAELISELKNKRFFDSRIRRIYELEAIDSFLLANDYVLDADVRYFTTLSDFWAFGNRPARQSGTRFSSSLNPGYSLSKYKESGYFTGDDELNNNLNALMINGGFDWEHEKPLNLYWQNSIHINAFAGIMEGKIKSEPNSFESKMSVPSIQFGYSQSIGYYPNTRTDMKFTYSANYVQLFDKTDFEKERMGVEGKGVEALANLSINYYISPKFRLNFSSSIQYIWQDSIDEVIINFGDLSNSNFFENDDMNYNSSLFREKDFAHSFSLRMVYSIF